MLTRIRKTMDEREGGFTLIELLVVMIILGMLAAIAIPVFLSQKNKAAMSALKSDARAIAQDVETYMSDYPTAVPSAGLPIADAASNTYKIDTLNPQGRTNPASVVIGKIVSGGSTVNYCVKVSDGASLAVYYTPGKQFNASAADTADGCA